MEYLVTMTTHVPGGTSAEAVEEVRSKEAVRSRELASEGIILRLWRPPLQPGEWRTLGLFAADGTDELERALNSMPLHVWRTDEVTPLAPHANDPGPEHGHTDRGSEYLVTFQVSIPAGTSAKEENDAEAQEAQRARELAEQGDLVRLWKLGEGTTLGLWQADGPSQLDRLLHVLPLSLKGWMTFTATPLTRHPNDPAARGGQHG